MATSLPTVGKKAPAFQAPVVGGDFPPGTTVSLADFQGRPLVLYFYPKDDTPGCTKQACALRDGWAEISARAAVLGVSIDSVKSHEKFIHKHQLPFPILSDEDHALAEAYGVWVEKSMYGKKYFGTERTTFVIDANGKLLAHLPKVKPEEHLGLVWRSLPT
jgi:thioredoxin-dependent peroxiredoxin